VTDHHTATSPAPATFDADVYSALGTPRPAVRLPESLFDGTVNMPVMHQAVKAFLANQRQGNAATKIRKYVTGGNQKPWKQKGTGRARQGSIRAPQWVGGGTVFGPIPRSYAQYVPRQVRALARKSALNARARSGAVKVRAPWGDSVPVLLRVTVAGTCGSGHIIARPPRRSLWQWLRRAPRPYTIAA